MMKIAFLMVRHPPGRHSPIMPAVIARLRSMRHQVDVLYPDETMTDLTAMTVDFDLYVLKSGTEVALSLAGALDALGATVLNPFRVAAACRDKVIATAILNRAGIPIPQTLVAARTSSLTAALDTGPLVVKPYRGSQGRGVRTVRDAADLDSSDAGDAVAFAQRYHEPQGRDRKLYCIGRQVFGVKRIWPATTYHDKQGQPFAVSPELRDITTACGEAMGMDLFGLDVIFSDGRPLVIDISSFPGFKGVPAADRLLAVHIDRVAARRTEFVPMGQYD